MTENKNYQSAILSELKNTKTPVAVIMTNGFQMRGYVTGFDAFTVVLTSDGKQQVIYKHAISTIIPERPVPLCDPKESA